MQVHKSTIAVQSAPKGSENPHTPNKQKQLPPMAKSLLLLLAVALAAASCFLAANAGVDFGSEMGWLAAARSGECDGLIGGCGPDGGEFEMESEISRRILATSRYISYAALNKNAIPCSRRGASYYNCRPGASANPYRRGCSAITRCRS